MCRPGRSRLPVARAFTALPETVTTRYFRGDSACYESNLLDWLSSPEREQEPGGRIGFAISAVMSPQLAQTIAALPEQEWTTYDTEPDGTLSSSWACSMVPAFSRCHCSRGAACHSRLVTMCESTWTCRPGGLGFGPWVVAGAGCAFHVSTRRNERRERPRCRYVPLAATRDGQATRLRDVSRD